MRRANTLAAKQAGFALPMVLTVVAILTLTYAVCLNQLVFLRGETKHVTDRAEFGRVAMTAEARMEYLMTTQPFGAASINVGATPNIAGANGALTQDTVDPTSPITLDDTYYKFLEQDDSTTPYLVQVQDEAGLFNLYGTTVTQLTNLFENYAGLDDQDAGNIATELQAYTVTPMAHQPLQKPAEIFSRLEDMSTMVSPHAWAKIADLVVAYPDNAAANVNTAPEQVIAALFNTDDGTAQSVVDNRPGAVISNVTTVGLTTPDPTKAYTFPNGRLRFTFTDPKSGLTYRSSLLYTPTDTSRPVWVENPRTYVTTPPADTDPDDLDQFPDIPNLTS